MAHKTEQRENRYGEKLRRYEVVLTQLLHELTTERDKLKKNLDSLNEVIGALEWKLT